jgi:hypothetical protein
MSRGPQLFKQGDVTKAVKAAVKAGLSVARVEILPDRIIVIAGKLEPEQSFGVEETSADLRRLL